MADRTAALRSQTFLDTAAEVLSLESTEEQDALIRAQGYDLDDFNKVYDEEFIPIYNRDLEAWQHNNPEGSREEYLADISGEFTDGTFAGRMVERAISSVVGGTVDLVDMIADTTETGQEVTDAIEGTVDSVIEHVPVSVRRMFAEKADPAHGFGTGAALEEVGGEILGLLGPGGVIAKGLTYGAKAAGAGRAVKQVAGAVARKSNTRRAVKVKKFLEDVGKGTALGTGTVLATPIVGDIEDDLAYYDEEGTETENLSQMEKYGYVLKKAAEEEAIYGLFGGAAFGTAKAVGKKLKLGSKVKQAINKSPKGKKLAEWFTATRGTDPEFLTMLTKREEAVHAAMQRSDGVLTELKKEVKKAGNITTEELHKALAGDRQVLMNIGSKSQKVSQLLMEMRGDIDIVSTHLANKVIGNKKTKETVQKNVGSYLNKAYEVFEDKQFRKALEKELQGTYKGTQNSNVANAINFIMRDHGVGEGEAKQRLLKLIRSSDTDEVLQSLNKGYAGTSKAFKARKQIPPEIRKLFGEEINDPYSAYARTMGKLSKMKAEHDFMEEAAAHLKEKGLLRKADEAGVDLDEVITDRIDSIFGRGTKADNPLAGLRLDKAYADTIVKGLEDFGDDLAMRDTTGGMLFRGWLKMKGASQAAKTIYNPATHAANTIGQATILLANGMLPVGRKGMKEAGQVLRKRVTGHTNKQLGEYLGRLQELGVVDQNLNVAMIKKNLGSAARNPMDFTDSVVKRRTMLDKAGAAAKWTNKKVMDIYQAEDDVFKVMHFEKSLDYLKKAFPDKSLPELEQMAAQRTKDLMPNYSQVNKAVSALRRSPFGDFITFPAEMIRTTKNLMKYTAQDAMSGNKTLMTEAAKKLAGITAVAQIPSIVQENSRMAHGVTADQEDALNTMVPNWEAYSGRIYTSGFNEDSNGHKGISYFRLGSLDPYDYFRTAAGALHQMASSMDWDEHGMRIEDRPEFNQAVTAMLDNQVLPIFGTSMASDVFLTLAGQGVDNRPSRQADALAAGFESIGVPPAGAKILSTVVEPFTPGFVNWFKKRHQFMDSGKSSKSDATITPDEASIRGLFGMGERRFDMSASLPFLLREHEQVSRQATQTMMQDIADPNVTDPSVIFDRYKDGVERSRKAQQEIRAITQAYRSMGFSDNDLLRALTVRKGWGGREGQSFGNMIRAERGIFIPPTLSKQAVSTAYQKNKDIPMDDIWSHYSDMISTPLYEY